jgi:hypothetical protein
MIVCLAFERGELNAVLLPCCCNIELREEKDRWDKSA